MVRETLTPQIAQEVIFQSEVVSDVENLKQVTSVAEFFGRANLLASNIYFSSNHEIFNGLKAATQGQIDVAKVEKAVKYHDYGDLSLENPLTRQLAECVSMKKRIAR